MTTKNRVHVIDIGSGNIGSLVNALERLSVEVIITCDVQELTNAQTIILPGVGNFTAVMKKLRQTGIGDYLTQIRLTGQKFLGICVGMQILFESSEEQFDDGETLPGIGLLPGHVKKLHDGSVGLPLPQIGWNSVEYTNSPPDLSGDYYYVNTYGVLDTLDELIIAKSHYGSAFVAAVKYNNIFGVQFHPEKSTVIGRSFLKWFLECELK